MKKTRPKAFKPEVVEHGFVKRLLSKTVASIHLRDRAELDRYNDDEQFFDKVNRAALRLSRSRGGIVQVTNPRGKPITWADAFSAEKREGGKLRTLSVDQTY